MLHNSSGSLNEKPAQVLVSTLWNLPQCLLASGRVFLGNHSQPGGEIAPFAKCRAVADGCDDRRCCYRTDSRHLQQPSFSRAIVATDLSARSIFSASCSSSCFSSASNSSTAPDSLAVPPARMPGSASST